MESFHWDKHFLTGFENVDNQHHRLVNMINQLGSLLAEDEIHLEDIDHLYNELADYSVYHFEEEEKMMYHYNIDSRHLNKHIHMHKQFLDDVSSIYSTISPDNISKANSFLEYLVHWLAYHILGQDQNMSKQIREIESGMTPKDAYEKIEQDREDNTAPLLDALNNLFELVSIRNHELKELTQSLEEKVIQRTEELSKANEHLKQLSLTDMLTTLPNRRFAMWHLSKLWNTSNEDNTPLSCLILDADHFKEVNDTYGHNTGDYVLIELSNTLKYNLRNDDCVCRIGGDEFLVILPDTTKEDAITLAENLRSSVSKLSVETGGEPWKGSVSIGVAGKDTTMNSYKILMKQADTSLYAAKEAGRNCVKSV